MPLVVIDGPSIEQGEALSSVANASQGETIRMTIAPNWPPKRVITFQISTDGEVFNDLYDADGHEVSVYGVPGAACVIPEQFRYVLYFKMRSGTADSPIPAEQRYEFGFTILKGGTAFPAVQRTKPPK